MSIYPCDIVGFNLIHTFSKSGSCLLHAILIIVKILNGKLLMYAYHVCAHTIGILINWLVIE